jgi:N-acetylglutamate synthase-like GNAT family acetyltransferase
MNVPSEWEVLSKKLIATKVFKRSRISAKSLYRIYLANRAFVMVEQSGGEKVIVAFGALWNTRNPKWLEMGTMWVDSSMQGKGVSMEMFLNLQKLSEGKSIFLITRNEKITKLAKSGDWLASKNISDSPCFKSGAISKKRELGEGRMICFKQSI